MGAALWAALGGSILVYLALTWATLKLAGLTGLSYYIVGGVLSALGIIAAAVFLWWKRRKGEGTDETVVSDTARDDEIDNLVRDADERLAASQLGSAARISSMPLLFVIGDQSTAKTSTVLNCGLQPELLAGQVYGDDNSVTPTRTANLWLAQNAILVEPAPRLLADQGRWGKLIRRLRPANLKSVVGGTGQAPRAALVCVSAEVFTQPEAADHLAAMARTLADRLGQVSQSLGISFPVYVLFTKCDRLPYFAEFVRALENEEAAQVVGATLPMRTSGEGVWAEAETRRLTESFNALFHALADRRIEFLPRETDPVKIPAAYEFPREFRKLRTPLVQFLVELCRPSQLRVSPFLRGFYFSGVRPVTIQENVLEPAPVQQKPFKTPASATGMFQIPVAGQPAPQATSAQYVRSKRIPQWVFLTRLFNSVLLADQAAFSASGASTKTSFTQRLLLAAAALVMLILGGLWTMSFVSNRRLVSEAVMAAEAIRPTEAAGAGLASLESLQKLETLRQALEQLTKYRNEGHPFGLGLGLWTGDDMYPHVRKAYYGRFHQLLFRQAQGELVKHLNGLPVAPGAKDDYGLTYDVLKGYLITTAASDKASDDSPAPILLSRWAEGRDAGTERMALAEKQFVFYGRDLKNGNPFSSTAEAGAVRSGRAFLSQFSGTERVYQFMIASASKKTVNYNRDIAGSSAAVINNRDVPGAFTKAGYAWMQDALKQADKFFGGERWVLCDAVGNVQAYNCVAGNIDRATLAQDLSRRYVDNYITQWRGYMRNTNVLRYTNLADASKKLNLHAGPQSPILAVFWLASQNTGIDATKIPGADRILKAFQSVQAVVPPGQADRYISDAAAGYHGALGTLKDSIDAAANQPKVDPATISTTLSNATSARAQIRTISQKFNIDQEDHLEQVSQRLLEAPITYAEALLRALGPKELNDKGAGMCSQISSILNKYPFNPTSPADASIAEVNQVLKPGEGVLWAFYEMNLKQALAKQGTQYVPTGEVPLNPGFVGFFNNLARLSDALYRSGPDPKLTYTVRPLKSDGIDNLVLHVDGQQIPASGSAKQVTWPGATQGARFTGKDLPSATMDGLWAAFRLFGGADTAEPSGTGYNLEWVMISQFAGARTSTVNAPRARYFVDMGGAPLFYRKGAPSIRCIPTVAK